MPTFSEFVMMAAFGPFLWDTLTQAVDEKVVEAQFQSSWEPVEEVGAAAVNEAETSADGLVFQPRPFSDVFHDDLRAWPRSFVWDAGSMVRFDAAISLGIDAGLTAIVANNWDDDVRERTVDHARRWGGLNNVFDVAGHPLTHLGATGVVYVAATARRDDKGRDFSRSLLNSLLLTDATVVALKYSFDTSRPNGERRGFPSGHVASSFAVAAVVEEYYGPSAGLIATLGAGCVAWQRIDDRKHELSDVFFGACLGGYIGHKIAKRRNKVCRDRTTLAPYADVDNGAQGIAVETKF